jgi:hypothetical protein
MSATARSAPHAPTADPAHAGARTEPRAAAGWAGLGYVGIFVLAVFGNFLAVGAVLDPGDASATATALAEAEGRFRLGATAFLVIVLLDVVVAWALHVLLRGVHADLSLLAAWFRLAYTVVLGVALVFLHLALLRSGGGPGDDREVLLALQAFDFTFVAGLAAFGVHLVLVGRLLLAAGASRVLAWLLVAAGAAYVLDTVAHLLLADYEAWSGVFLAVVAVPSVLGELGLTIWLLRVATGRRPVPTRVG